MNGPSEFHVIGSIRDWQSKDRLGEIDVPTLLVSGRHDEATPALQETLRDGIRGSSGSASKTPRTCRTSRSASATCRSSATGSRSTTDYPGRVCVSQSLRNAISDSASARVIQAEPSPAVAARNRTASLLGATTT